MKCHTTKQKHKRRPYCRSVVLVKRPMERVKSYRRRNVYI